MRVVYHPHAEAELIEAAKYYESCVDGLGKRFLNESDYAMSLIGEDPRRWRRIWSAPAERSVDGALDALE